MVNFGRPGGVPLMMIRELNGGAIPLRQPPFIEIFAVDPPKTTIDSMAEASVAELAKAIPAADVKKIEDELRKSGNSTAIAKVTSFLNKQPLDDGTRLLLSSKPLYLKALDEALKGVGSKFEDTGGIADGVLRKTEETRKALVRDLVKDVLKARNVDLQQNQAAVDAAVSRLEGTLTFTAGKVEPAILAAYESIIKTGGVPEKVEAYLKKEGLPKQDVAIVRSMTEYLLRFVGIDAKKLDIAKHQEFFALAFEYARRRARGEDDPIDAMRTKGASSEWDYKVDLFEAIDEQPVIAENILVAGALDYLWQLGETMGVFKIADAVILEWGAGVLDVTGESADKLYRYYKLREERSSEEERGMLYRRVLGRGDAEVLSDAVVNEPFAPLWHKLMSEVTRFIRKIEQVEVEKVRVSASAIYQAARDIQYNLTEFGTGLAHKQTFEVYKNFEEAMEVLGDSQVIEHYTSGRRKNVWAVIERIAKTRFGTSLNLSALKTLAVEGNKVYRWLSDFRFAQPTVSNLQALLDSGEAWIIAQAEIDGQQTFGRGGDEEGEEEIVDEGSPQDDVDEDWDG